MHETRVKENHTDDDILSKILSEVEFAFLLP